MAPPSFSRGGGPDLFVGVGGVKAQTLAIFHKDSCLHRNDK